MDIRIEQRKDPKVKPQKGEALGFGDIFTDHMFLMDYTEGKGWHDARIVPYAPLSLDPAAMVFHYA
ncbi:MAG: branched chain amino acid aminotransferase, partial [Eubacteriales bacterium]